MTKCITDEEDDDDVAAADDDYDDGDSDFWLCDRWLGYMDGWMILWFCNKTNIEKKNVTIWPLFWFQQTTNIDYKYLNTKDREIVR